MSKRTVVRLLLVVGLLVVLAAALSPWLVQGYWSMRSSNPVRRGVARAGELGCFHCHGAGGANGLPDPVVEPGVPGWAESGDPREIRGYVLKGSDFKHEALDDPAIPQPIRMPAYEDLLTGSDLDDLVAAVTVLAGRVRPAEDTAARRGLEIAEHWRCFQCHGAAGSGGLPNPGSFTGFIPGWYGADFEDLVRDRAEFDAWVRDGRIERLERSRIAAFFARRQQVQMPRYRNLSDTDLDDLWAYIHWGHSAFSFNSHP